MGDTDSEFDSDAAEESLEAISRARKSSAELAVKTPWWYAPAIYLCVGCTVALPGIPDIGIWKFIPLGVILVLLHFRRNITGTEPAKEYLRATRIKVLVAIALLGFISLYLGGLLLSRLVGLGYAPFFAGATATLLCWWIDQKEAKIYLSQYIQAVK